MNRVLTVVIAFTLVLSVLPAPVSGAVNASITDVTVTPEQAAPGEGITVHTTIQNLQSSTADYDVTAVYIRSTTGSLVEHDRVKDPGVVSPGSTLEVPLRLSFGTAGTRELRVYVVGRDENDEIVRLTFPSPLRSAATTQASLSTWIDQPRA